MNALTMITQPGTKHQALSTLKEPAMNPRTRASSLAAILTATLVAISSAYATDVTWDIAPGTVSPPAGDSAITGGAGTWNTSNGNWTTDGGVNNIAWVNANNDTAVFGGTAGLVTLGEAITVGGLKFDTAGYTFSASAGALTFGASGDINTNILSTENTTLSSTLLTVGASETVTKTGAGILTFSGAADNANFQGVFSINEGIVRLSGSSTNRKYFGSITLNGGTLQSYADNLTMNTTDVNVTGDSTIQYNRSTTSSTQDNTFALGNLSIGSHTLYATKITGDICPITFLSTTLTGNAVFDVQARVAGSSYETDLRLGNLSDSGSGRTITKNGPGPLTWGTITLSGNHIWNVNESTLTSGAITTGGNSLTKGGAGTLNLTGAFTGGNVVLNGGTMNFANTTNTAGTLTLSASSTLGLGTGSTSFSGGAGDWTGLDLNLTGTLGPATTSLRFGTDNTGLSAAQLDRITYTLASGVAKPVSLDASGYIRSTSYDGSRGTSGVNPGNWSSTAIWDNGIIATGEDATASFGGTSGAATWTTTVDTARTIGHIFKSGNKLHVIDSSGGGVLTLAVSSGMPTIGMSSRSYSIPISATLAGDDGLETGYYNSSDPNGTIILSGNNTYTGTTSIKWGTIVVGHANALSTSTISFGGGGLASSDTTAYSFANTIEIAGNVIIGKGNSSNPGVGTGALSFTDTAATALGVTRTFTVDPSTTATFAQAFSGTAGITKSGTGTLALTGASTYDGVTTISDGALEINSIGSVNGSASSLGIPTSAANGRISIGNVNPTALVYKGTGETTDREIYLARNNVMTAAIDQSGTGLLKFNTALGFIAMGANGTRTLLLTGSTTGTGEFAGAIGQTSAARNNAVTKEGTGTWTLSGNNTYTGATTVSAGTLIASHNSALGGTENGTTVSSGAALALQGGITVGAEALSLNGTGISDGGALRNISGDNTYAGLITLQSASRINSDAGLLTLDVASGDAITGTFNLTFGGAGNITVADNINISTGTLTKDGNGILTLSDTNTYTGATSVTEGTLVINGSTHADSAVSVTSGATLGGAGTVFGTTSVTSGTVNGSGLTLSDATTFTGAGNTLSGTVTSTSGVSLASGAALALNGGLTGTLDVGDGTLTGTGGSVSGATTLNGGTINLTSGTLGSLDVTGGGNWSGEGTVTGLATVVGGTLTIIGPAGDLTASSGLQVNSGATLTGSGTVTGNVTVNSGGTLAGTVTITGDATIAGTHSPGNSPGTENIMSDLTYLAGATVEWDLIANAIGTRGTDFDAINVGVNLDFAGATTINLIFNDGSAVDWEDFFWLSSYTGTGGWLIWQVEGSTSNFGNLSIGSIGLDSQGQALSDFYMSTFSLFLDNSTGYVYLNYNYIAIPEPSTLLLAGLGLAGMTLRRRRR